MVSDTLSRRAKIEFDDVSEEYAQLVDESVRITGESSSYFAEYKARYIARFVIGRRAAGKVLDFGCGIGLLATHLKSYLPEMRIDGFDPSVASLERVDTMLRNQGIFTSDPGALPCDYTVVVLANVLHHVSTEERTSVIRSAAARLAPGGRLVVFEHNPVNPLTRWAVSHCPFDEGVVLLRAAEVRWLCSQELQLLSCNYIVFFPRMLQQLRPIERFLGWCPAGGQHVTVAQKAP